MERASLSAGKSYSDQRDYILAVLRRRCAWLAPDEREAIFHDAYAVLLEKERDGALDTGAMHSNQLRAYLSQTAIFKALDEGKRAERTRSEPLADSGAFDAPESRPLEDSISAEMEGARVREIVQELPQRRAEIVKLRFFFERTPDEIQGLLGISSRVYRRELERAFKQIADRFELLRAGRFCDSKRSLLLAYVSGVAGPGKAKEARAHLETCSGCAAWAIEMRETARRAAVLLPVPALSGIGSRLPRLSGTLTGIREHLVSISTGAKQQAASFGGRFDPGAGGYLGGVRPSAVAAAVAGCIAVSGGAYCAVQGVPDSLFSAAPSTVRNHASRPEPAHRRVAHHIVQPPAAAVHRTPTPTPSPSPSPTPTPTPTPKNLAHGETKTEAPHESQLQSEAAAAEEEFGPAPSSEAAPEYSEPEASSSGSSGSYQAPSNAAPPPKESVGGEAEFGP